MTGHLKPSYNCSVVCSTVNRTIATIFNMPLPACFLGDSGKVTTVVATPGQGPDRPQEVSYTDIKVRKKEKLKLYEITTFLFQVFSSFLFCLLRMVLLSCCILNAQLWTAHVKPQVYVASRDRTHLCRTKCLYVFFGFFLIFKNQNNTISVFLKLKENVSKSNHF